MPGKRVEMEKSANARARSQEKATRYPSLHLLPPPPFLPPKIPRTLGWGSTQFHLCLENQGGLHEPGLLINVHDK